MNTLFLGNHSLFVNGTRLSAIGSAPGPTPPSLPPFTIRLKFKEGVTPTFAYGTGVQVSSSPNVWDLTYENTSWSKLLRNQTNLLEVVAANTTGIKNMGNVFYGCSALTTVPLFDTSSATTMSSMFSRCSSLTTIPLFNTSHVTSMMSMFYNCTKVQSGALALYRQASTQASVPTHDSTFRYCGRDTTAGAAELAQIPDEWK